MGWISVEDRLPKDGDYLCSFMGWDDRLFLTVLDYDVNNESWSDNNGDDFYKVTHWMILPEPPKNRYDGGN
jgi:hypothetical protein